MACSLFSLGSTGSQDIRPGEQKAMGCGQRRSGPRYNGHMRMPSESFGLDRYGDYAGVAFYGPPNRGFWTDCFEASYIYLEPIFSAILALTTRQSDAPAPQVIQQWRDIEGWADSGTRTELDREQVAEL